MALHFAAVRPEPLTRGALFVAANLVLRVLSLQKYSARILIPAFHVRYTA
jgi:hypothetical protein